MPSFQGNLPDPGIEPVSLTSPALTGRFFTTSTTRQAPDVEAIAVCILILYFANFLNYFIVSLTFIMDSFRLFINTII